MKVEVYEFWNKASCGEDLYLSDISQEGYISHAKARYKIEPFILDFAQFDLSFGKTILEIGVGLGAYHQKFAEAGAVLYGIDLTERAIEHSRRRLAEFGLSSKLEKGDAESLDFQDEYFDQVYSWGVLHHSPDTSKAILEVKRVLKPGGVAKIMIYHKFSIVGTMLWVRYALLKLQPWKDLVYIYANYLESPGTKAYSVSEARKLFSEFSQVQIKTVLTHGDLLESDAGQRHQGVLLSIARYIWPRQIIRKMFPAAGLFMLIEATK